MQSETTKVLLIESDPTLAEVTMFRLELLGYSVRCAHSAEEAQEALALALPDVIIANTELPSADGLELANRLSSDRKTAHIPVMAVSSSADLETVRRAFAAGAKDYLLTPYDPAVLEQKLHKLVSSVGAGA